MVRQIVGAIHRFRREETVNKHLFGGNLRGKIQKFANCHKHNIARAFVLPFICVQVCNSAGQVSKPFGVGVTAPNPTNLFAKLPHSVIVSLNRGVGYEDGWDYCTGNFRVPFLQKSDKDSFAGIGIPAPGKPIVGASTNKPASDASQYQFYGLKEDLIEFAHYLIVAIIAGIVASAYTRRHCRDRQTYPQKGGHGE
jgi:hypothetical protein